jgi:hypothetical protein
MPDQQASMLGRHIIPSPNQRTSTYVPAVGPTRTSVTGGMHPHWKTLIEKATLWRREDGLTGVNTLASSLSILNSFTWLRDLELDANLLNEEPTALALLDCRIASLQNVRFVVECPHHGVLWRYMEPPTHVWNELDGRVLLVGGFSEIFARCIKSLIARGLRARDKSADIQRQRRPYEVVSNDDRLCDCIEHFLKTVDSEFSSVWRV